MTHQQICEPAFCEWNRVLQSNHEVLQRIPEQWKQLRTELRTRLLELTGFRSCEEHHPLLLGTGHQAQIFHSGVYEKYRRLGQLCQDSSLPVCGIAVTLDLDPADVDGLKLRLPVKEKDDALSQIEERISTPGTLPILQNVTTEDVLNRILARDYFFGDRETQIQRGESLRQWIVEYFRVPSEPVSNALTRARRLWGGGQLSYTDLLLSELAKLQETQEFLLSLFQRPSFYYESYNSLLASHRKRRNIQNSANPFPSLASSDGFQELPLWFMSDVKGERETVAVKTSAGRAVVRVGRAELPLAKFEAALRSRSTGAISPLLLPRGAMVSFFFRLLCFDGFIHGTGGRRYDSFTDELFPIWAGIEAPIFFTASADRFLFSEARESLVGLREDVQSLRNLYSHPDEALALLEPPQFATLQELIIKRNIALHELRDSHGTLRSSAGKTLAGINATIKKLIDEAYGNARRRELDPLERSSEVILSREFPFFLFENDTREG